MPTAATSSCSACCGGSTQTAPWKWSGACSTNGASRSKNVILGWKRAKWKVVLLFHCFKSWLMPFGGADERCFTPTWGQPGLFCLSIMGWNYVSALCMSAFFAMQCVTAPTTMKLYNWINYTKFWWRGKTSHSILMPANPSRSLAFTYSSLYCILTGRDTFLHINTSSLQLFFAWQILKAP